MIEKREILFMIGIIKGTGSCVPNKVVDNNDLAKLVETNDQWIRERTGVIKRRIIEEETTISMAANAARKACENAEIDPVEIDMIIVATISTQMVMPNTACLVQHEIGATKAVCFDLNAACSGFVFAYNTAQAYISTGQAKHVLVIGAESLSTIVDWTDRGTCILFGDGAAATVLSAEEGDIYPMVMHANGTKGSVLSCNTASADKEINPYIQMDGQEVFKFAVRQVPNCIEELLIKLNKEVDEIDLFILHQANKRIVESVSKRLKQDIDKFPMNLMEYGNTSSASIPILLDELNQQGKLKKGMKIILAGFGGGLTWGATYLEWQK